jgi:hypothetical protein
MSSFFYLTTPSTLDTIRQTKTEGKDMKKRDIIDLIYLGIFAGCVIIGSTLIGAING